MDRSRLRISADVGPDHVRHSAARRRPLGLRTFGTTPDFAKASKALAANQGLYNGFVATGLGWGLVLGDAGISIQIFFLCCVVVAGVFGGFTASRKIFWVQALPGAAALALVLLA